MAVYLYQQAQQIPSSRSSHFLLVGDSLLFKFSAKASEKAEPSTSSSFVTLFPALVPPFHFSAGPLPRNFAASDISPSGQKGTECSMSVSFACSIALLLVYLTSFACLS